MASAGRLQVAYLALLAAFSCGIVESVGGPRRWAVVARQQGTFHDCCLAPTGNGERDYACERAPRSRRSNDAASHAAWFVQFAPAAMGVELKNIATYGYKQTVAGMWRNDAGVYLYFGIDTDRAERFIFEIGGRKTARITQRLNEGRIQRALLGLSLEGTGATEDAARYQATLSKGGALAIMAINMINIWGSFRGEQKPYSRIKYTSFALGGLIKHGNEQWEWERWYGEGFQRAMQNRGGLMPWDNLNWVNEHYRDAIASGPYFKDDRTRWWEYGMIAIPHGVAQWAGSSAQTPADMLLRVCTDKAGNNMGLQLISTYNHQVRGSMEGQFVKVNATPTWWGDSNQTDIVEAWES
jgi:hypothetical protein